MINIKVKKISETAKIPFYATKQAACFDLVADESTYIPPQETKIIPTNLIFEVPEGYKMVVYPRSGISAKTPLRISNTPGIIDSDFRADVKLIITNTLQLINFGQKNNMYYTLDRKANYMSAPEMKKNGFGNEIPFGTFLIQKGERLAQAEIVPVIKAEFEEVQEVSETERGEGGLGSTGTE